MMYSFTFLALCIYGITTPSNGLYKNPPVSHRESDGNWHPIGPFPPVSSSGESVEKGETWILVTGTIPSGSDGYPGIKCGTPMSCPPNSHGVQGTIVGFRTKSEKHQGAGDDSALNGVEFKCSDGSTLRSTEGPVGEWNPWQQCDNGKNFTGVRLKVEIVDEGGGCSGKIYDPDKWDNSCTIGNQDCIHAEINTRGTVKATAYCDGEFTKCIEAQKAKAG